ncbi:hypothetical protein DVH24_028142 [Malus domestica]|uniref:Uncharacterized protein n=1 Tax=Malus domestica TaxID=3750 RepID=A0A498HEW5_MALDO|nr:hypothetical protein DVH24_028142 [Malus domestica]
MFLAVKKGHVEYITHLCRANGNFIFVTDEKGRFIYQVVAECRQRKVFSLLYGIYNQNFQRRVAYVADKSKNNLMHVVGTISSAARINHIRGTALQMQRELQWFEIAMADTLSPNPATPKQRLPRAARLQSPTSPFFLGSNDDHRERAQARAACAAEIRRKSVALNLLPQQGDPDPCLRKAQILELFQNCIKLDSENVSLDFQKTNQKNTWELNLIDHLTDIFKVEEENDAGRIFKRQAALLKVVYNASKLSELVNEKKKIQNWLDYYQLKFSRNSSKRPSKKTGFLGLWGKRVDAIDFIHLRLRGYQKKQISLERDKITSSPKSIMPAAFVSFRTRWGAAKHNYMVDEWAPEPRDVYWDNLAMPYVTLTIRRLVVAVAFFFLTFFFMIPIAFAQSLANIEGFEKAVPFLKPIIEVIPKTIGVSIPMKATFFITYIMVDGWAGIAGEILRLKPLIIYHLKIFFLVKTEKDREEAMDPGTLGFNTGEPQIQLYFLLGLVYAVVSPIPLPFIIVFFALAYVVYRHQIINVYNQEYESGAAFWPDVHGRIITALLVSQLLLMGLLSTKEAAQSTPLLITLPVLTIWFHRFCKGRYEPAFIRHPLQEAMMKDTLEPTREPNLIMKGFLQNAYIHPVFKGEDDSENDAPAQEFAKEPAVVLTKRSSRRNTPMPSKYSGSSSSASIPEDDTQKMIP